METIENKLKAKLQGAESSAASQEMKNRMWANISKSVPQQPMSSGQGASAAKSAAGELTKSVVKTKFFIGGMSKFTTSVIIGVVTATIGSVVLFNNSSDSANANNQIQESVANTFEATEDVQSGKEVVYQNASVENVSANINVEHTVSKPKDSEEMLVLNESDAEPETVVQNYSEDAPSQVEAISRKQNDAETERVDKEDSPEAFVREVEQEKTMQQLVDQTEDTEQSEETDIAPVVEEPEETATVVVNRPVIIENKEVKIVKKKSRYSKKTRK